MMVHYCCGIQMAPQKQNFQIISAKFDQNIANKLPITLIMIISSENPLHAALA